MATKGQAVSAGILVTLLLFVLGLFESELISSAIVVIGFAFVGIAVLSWLVVVGRELLTHRA